MNFSDKLAKKIGYFKKSFYLKTLSYKNSLFLVAGIYCSANLKIDGFLRPL